VVVGLLSRSSVNHVHDHRIIRGRLRADDLRPIFSLPVGVKTFRNTDNDIHTHINTHTGSHKTC
jgi:hypothetical protein